MNCATCKENKVADVPYIVYEGEVSRMERVGVRWMVIWIITFVLLVCSNVFWIWRDSQFVDESWTYEASTEDGGNAVINGEGSVNIYGESESYPDSQNP